MHCQHSNISPGPYFHHLANLPAKFIPAAQHRSPSRLAAASASTRGRGVRAEAMAGRTASARRGELAARDFPAGTPGFLFALPAAPRQPTGFRHGLIRIFLMGSAQKSTLSSASREISDRQQACGPAGARSLRASGVWEGACRRGSHMLCSPGSPGNWSRGGGCRASPPTIQRGIFSPPQQQQHK